MVSTMVVHYLSLTSHLKVYSYVLLRLSHLVVDVKRLTCILIFLMPAQCQYGVG